MPDNTTALGILREARALISEPGAWCQGALERDGAHCALGALYMGAFGRVGVALADQDPDQRGAYLKTWRAMTDATNGNLVDFNNTRSHTEVLGAFDDAIAKLEEFAEPELPQQALEDSEQSIQRATDFILGIHLIEEAMRGVQFDLDTGDSRR